VELYLHSPSTPSWRGAQFKKKKHRDNFNFTNLYIEVQKKRCRLEGRETIKWRMEEMRTDRISCASVSLLGPEPGYAG
jgi:hypothetical protein